MIAKAAALLLGTVALVGCGGAKASARMDDGVCRQGLAGVALGDQGRDNDIQRMRVTYGLPQWGGWGKWWHPRGDNGVVYQRFWLHNGRHWVRFRGTCGPSNSFFFDNAGPA